MPMLLVLLIGTEQVCQSLFVLGPTAKVGKMGVLLFRNLYNASLDPGLHLE